MDVRTTLWAHAERTKGGFVAYVEARREVTFDREYPAGIPGLTVCGGVDRITLLPRERGPVYASEDAAWLAARRLLDEFKGKGPNK